jgi:hypothetical protein
MLRLSRTEKLSVKHKWVLTNRRLLVIRRKSLHTAPLALVRRPSSLNVNSVIESLSMVIALFDKSFLQSLSLDEAVLFDNFFYPNISPIFFVETLADLAKDLQDRTPEREVQIIADKTPQVHGGPNMFHGELCLGDLLGHRVSMKGQILVPPAPLVGARGRTGVVHKEPPEREAFSRWQDGQFTEVERRFAKVWREALAKLDFQAVAARLSELGVNAKSCKSLEDTRGVAEKIVSARGSYSLLEVAMTLQGIPTNIKATVIERWKAEGYPRITKFAPYSSFVLEVDLFFYSATAAKLLSLVDVNNRTDLAYLYYLPFCMIFVSGDTFHKRCAPLFLRPDQEFVWGPDLKAALKKLNEYYRGLTEKEKEKGLSAFAVQPPPGDDSLITKLWDKFLRQSWRDAKQKTPRNKQQEAALLEQLKEMSKAPAVLPGTIDLNNSDDLDYVVIERQVQRRRGNYWQVPKDLKDIEED